MGDYGTMSERDLEDHLRSKAEAEPQTVEFRVEEPSEGYYRAGFFIPGEPDSPVSPEGVMTKGAEGSDRQRVLVDFAASLDLDDVQDQRSS